ncbi:hypothetical protein DLAC_04445 [Tieghemostelium lacteum]|uniref:Tc1-like transposase DDE domain-containing protein n=1 Tax=Tieghemostelium lacteum TaxID=361077 RepID=A0A151ZJN1_TIELA|nr:hypothetical protein DLAC_04445 [Tieghemostelium lacteum]|eukprot:KYQ94156.1 hypothetical protein DLAC_04445 [Tieghemostelium lacteum]
MEANHNTTTTTTTTTTSTIKNRRRSYNTKTPYEWSIIIEDALVYGVPHTSEKFGVKKTTLYQKIKKFSKELSIESLDVKKRGTVPGSTKSKKITGNLAEFVLKEITEDNTLSGKQLAQMLAEESKRDNPESRFTISATTVNKFLKDQQFSYKVIREEEVERNSETLLEERKIFSKMVLENNYRKSPRTTVYFDFMYVSSNIIARRGRSKIGTPAIVHQSHRGIHIHKYPSTRKSKNSEGQVSEENVIDDDDDVKVKEESEEESEEESDQESDQEESDEDSSIALEELHGIVLLKTPPISTDAQKVNSLAVCAAITGEKVLLVSTQFRRFNSEDFYQFMGRLLAKLKKEYPNESFTFVGDNESVYKQGMDLLMTQEHRHHSYIPNPRYSPFLNAIEFMFNQLKYHIAGLQHKLVGDLIISCQQAIKKIQPGNLLNYHETVHIYLLKCLQREEIHAWRTVLNEKARVPDNAPDQNWECFHRTIFSTERDCFTKYLVNGTPENPVKPGNQAMILNDKKIPLFNDLSLILPSGQIQEVEVDQVVNKEMKKRGRPPKTMSQQKPTQSSKRYKSYINISHPDNYLN